MLRLISNIHSRQRQSAGAQRACPGGPAAKQLGILWNVSPDQVESLGNAILISLLPIEASNRLKSADHFGKRLFSRSLAASRTTLPAPRQIEIE